NPLRAILPFVAIPLVLRFQIRFAVWREALDLLFREVYLKIVIMFRRAVQAFRGNDEFLAAQPAAGVDNYVADIAGSVIEDDVVDLSEFFVIYSIEMRTANIVLRS